MVTAVNLEEDKNEFLGAVQNVLHNRSAATEADLVGAAACQHLRQGPASLEEVQLAVKKTWPRCAASSEQVLAALEVSRDLGLVAQDEGQGWVLTAKGLEDITRHDEWVFGLRERTAADIRVRARQGLGVEPDADEANLWLDALVAALVPSIEQSIQDHLGSAKSLIEGSVMPRPANTGPVLQRLEGVSPRVEVVKLLQALAVNALDPLDTFGLELVTHITTGSILHSYVAASRASRGALDLSSRAPMLVDSQQEKGPHGPRQSPGGAEYRPDHHRGLSVAPGHAPHQPGRPAHHRRAQQRIPGTCPRAGPVGPAHGQARRRDRDGFPALLLRLREKHLPRQARLH